MTELLTYLKDPAVQAALAGVIAWALQRWCRFIPGNDGSATWAKKASAVALALVAALVISASSGNWAGFVVAALAALGGSQVAFGMAAATGQPRDPVTGQFAAKPKDA